MKDALLKKAVQVQFGLSANSSQTKEVLKTLNPRYKQTLILTLLLALFGNAFAVGGFTNAGTFVCNAGKFIIYLIFPILGLVIAGTAGYQAYQRNLGMGGLAVGLGFGFFLLMLPILLNDATGNRITAAISQSGIACVLN